MDHGSTPQNGNDNLKDYQKNVHQEIQVEVPQVSALRKSMPGSTTGLKQMGQQKKEHIFQSQQQHIFQQNQLPSGNNRQSHSQVNNTNLNNENRENNEKVNHMSHSQPSHSYQSAQQNNRVMMNNVGMFSQNNQVDFNKSNAQITNNYVGTQNQIPFNQLTGTVQISGVMQNQKLHNQAILGVTNQGVMSLNQNSFSLNNQNGLFPKIQNLRIESQSIPTTTHGQAGLLQSNVKAAESNHIFKNNGGHISGMSNHQTHQTLSKQDQNGLFHNSHLVTSEQTYKPMQSPRHPKLDSQPDQIQQAQVRKNQATYAEFKKQLTQNKNETGLSPMGKNQENNQRQNQMSSGSEKRLKMQQQRQYYSDQYRFQQQKQLQQTGNAVMGKEIFNQSSSNQVENSTNSNSSQQKANLQTGRQTNFDQNKSNDYSNVVLSKQEKIPQSLNTTNLQLIQKNMNNQILHQNVLLSGHIPLSGSMVISNHNQLNMTIQQHQQISSTINPTLTSNVNKQSSNQVFFKKRCSSNNNVQSSILSPNAIQSDSNSKTNDIQNHSISNNQTHPSIQQARVSSQPSSQQKQLELKADHDFKETSQKQSTSDKKQKQTDSAEEKGSQEKNEEPASGSQVDKNQTQQSNQQTPQQQTPPKIPVICGFHKRILLITCQNNQNENGIPNINNMSQNAQIAQARRIRNKNPNCNHNSNSVFYQPHYNNVKYDDSHKKKEDVLRKVFFKECAKEEEKRLYGVQGQVYPNCQAGIYGQNDMTRQQAYNQANDPNKHLQIIDRILCEYLFVSQPFDRNAKTQLTNTQSLMMELGLDRALTPHRGFLLALIRAGKFSSDNMLKVLSEVKTSATEFDNECIYCKYSQYALKESAKLLHKHQQALIEQSQSNPQQALAIHQYFQNQSQTPIIIKGPSGEDIRIENLVRMFQSQLFKKSFINTSLMIIQRKMTEKYFQRYQNAKQAQQADQSKQGQGQVQYGPDGKPIDQPKKINKKIKPKGQPNLSCLEYLAKEIQKLAKNLANPKDKERYLDLKEKYYREFLIKILKSNGVEKIQFPTATFAPYKYYIGKGNNSAIVRTALKSRFWWAMGEYDDWSDYNFVWTQWKANKVINNIKTWKEVQELEAKDAANPDKKRSSQSTRAGGIIDSKLSTAATDKESNSSKENLINTPKKNKLASASLGNNSSSEPQFKKNSNTAQHSANKNKFFGRGKRNEEKEDEKEENITSHNLICYAKQENNYHLANKKALFYNLKVYLEALGIDYHSQLPLTFHIKEGLIDPQFLKFENIYNEANAGRQTVLDQYPKFGKHLWIVKPGENTNRGLGITVCKDLDQIKNLVQNTNFNGNKRSYIIQKYIEKPLLYKNRKFDIRIFTLMCTINGNLQGYWYSEGYLRTSSREFSLRNINNRYIHLTNDAVQKKLDDYGKFESGNKLTYAEFQKYLDTMKVECDFIKDLVPKMKKLAQHSMRAVSRKLDPHRRAFTFEIYGYDFMIDEDLNPWMIEVNTNPCFELSCPYLARLIPAMVENSLKVALDPIFPPPPVPNSKKHQLPDAIDNKFELIFNERSDASELKNLPIDDNMNGIIEEEEKEEEGSDEEEEEEHHD